MAIGKKGSFATTQAPVVDFGSIIRNAQNWQTEFNKRRNKVIDKFNEEKKKLASSVTLPEFGTSTTKSNIAVKTELASRARDAIFDLTKQAEQARFGGDVSLSDLRIKAQELEGQMQLYKETADFISNPESEFVTASNNGDLSEFVSEGTYNVIGGIANLDLEGVDINENNKVILKTKNEEGEVVEYSLEDYNKLVRNFPKNPKTDSVVSRLSEKFKNQVRQNPKGYLDIKTTGMSQGQVDEITDDAYGIANNPMYFTQVVGEVTGVSDVFKVDQLKDIENPDTGEAYTLDEIRNQYAEKMIAEVQNRMDDEIITTKSRSDKRKDDEVTRELEKEQAVEDYGVSKTSSLIVTGMDEGLSSNSIKVNASYSQPITLRTKEGVKTISNLTLKEIALDNNNNFVIYGETQVTEGAKQKINKALDEITTELPALDSESINNLIEDLESKKDIGLTTQSLLLLKKTIKEKGVLEDGKLTKDSIKEISRDLVPEFSRVRGVVPRTEIGSVLSRFGGAEEIKKKLKRNIQTSGKAKGL